MSLEHHDLVHDFPELRDQIHELKINNRHFRKLFDEYHEVTSSVENMEKMRSRLLLQRRRLLNFGACI